MKERQSSYPVMFRCDICSFLGAAVAYILIERQCKVEQAANPARELDDIHTGLARGKFDDLIEN